MRSSSQITRCSLKTNSLYVLTHTENPMREQNNDRFYGFIQEIEEILKQRSLENYHVLDSYEGLEPFSYISSYKFAFDEDLVPDRSHIEYFLTDSFQDSAIKLDT